LSLNDDGIKLALQSREEWCPTDSDVSLTGHELRKLLPGPSVLHQLLLSTLMLHRSCHEDWQKPISLERWLELNEALPTTQVSGLRALLENIYQIIHETVLPGIWTSNMNTPEQHARGVSAVKAHAQVECWAHVYWDDPSLTQRSLQTRRTEEHWQLYSEATASSRGRRIGPKIRPASPMRDGLPYPQNHQSQTRTSPHSMSTGQPQLVNTRLHSARSASGADDLPTACQDAVWLSLLDRSCSSRGA